jgi:hypothetical protein
MNHKNLAIAVLVVLLALSTAVVLTSLQTSGVDEPKEPAPSAETEKLSEDAQASVDGATALKESLVAEGYEDARVFVQQDGTVGVMFTPQDSNAAKQEMYEVAVMYAGIVEDNPDMGGLTISVNGVAMLVSQDAALAHANGEIDEEAFKETVAIKSENSTEAQ